MKIVPRRTWALIGGDGKILGINARDRLMKMRKPCELVCEVEIRAARPATAMRATAIRAILQAARLREHTAEVARTYKKPLCDDESWKELAERCEREEKGLREIAEEI